MSSREKPEELAAEKLPGEIGIVAEVNLTVPRAIVVEWAMEVGLDGLGKEEGGELDLMSKKGRVVS